MLIITDIISGFSKPTVVTFGKFDGIHKGHQCLINKAKEIAAEENLQVVVCTFKMIPGTKFHNDNTKKITTDNERRRILEKMGVDVLVEYPLDDETSSAEPIEFLEKIVKNYFHAKYVVVGNDWRFGNNRSGDADILKASQKLLDFTAVVMDKANYEGREISSTWVREEIASGNMENINILLGYPYLISGVITHGNEIGRTMGFPTVNIIPEDDKMIPPFGVYASKLNIEGHIYYGITNIGVKPTVTDDGKITVETHILDFNESVYNKEAEVSLFHFQRPEMKFDGIDRLKNQLTQDIDFAKSYFLI